MDYNAMNQRLFLVSAVQKILMWCSGFGATKPYTTRIDRDFDLLSSGVRAGGPTSG